MLYYHFTNDLRFAQVYQNMGFVAKYIKSGVWEHPKQTLENAKNGWFPVYEFYFGLYKGSHNVDLILDGKQNYVLGEFIKKFQFPNPKNDRNDSYKKELANNQLNAPLRTLMQLLVYGSIYEGTNWVYTNVFKYYIIANEEVAKNRVTIGDLYSNIKNQSINIEDIDFSSNVTVSGGDPRRLVGQLLGVLEPLDYISIEDDKIVLDLSKVQGEDKGILFDIINYNGYWEEDNSLNNNGLIMSYKEYMQAPEKTSYQIQVEVKKETNETRFSPNLINEVRQYIYFGAPGTGKSYQLDKDSKMFSEKNVERVTFHPNMTYGQFVGVFKPTPIREDKITYKYVEGPLMKQLVQALLHPESAFLLIIEEMNRANVAAVFGDMFQLLDRGEDFISEYPISISQDMQWYFENNVYLAKENEEYILNMKKQMNRGLIFPSNFFIWSTMNSADQGVMPMDTAFKRRWEQKYFGIDKAYEENKDQFDNYKKIIVGKNDDSKLLYIEWNILRRFINRKLIKLKVPEDKLLGPYFISKTILQSTNENLTDSFKTKVLMYLFEDAAKQKRTEFFSLSKEDMIYSKLIEKFERDGIDVFIDSEELVKHKKIGGGSNASPTI